MEGYDGYTKDQEWGGSWGDPPLIRYIRNVLGISKVGHILGKGCEAFKEKIPAFSKELENNLCY